MGGALERHGSKPAARRPRKSPALNTRNINGTNRSPAHTCHMSARTAFLSLVFGMLTCNGKVRKRVKLVSADMLANLFAVLFRVSCSFQGNQINLLC